MEIYIEADLTEDPDRHRLQEAFQSTRCLANPSEVKPKCHMARSAGNVGLAAARVR